MAVNIAPPVVVPLYVQLGDGDREHVGDVTVALESRGRVDDAGRHSVWLGLTNPALVTDQVANLLDNAAHTLRKGVIVDAAPPAR